ncbi:phosphate acetyltransferase [Snodgrassella alvi]|uniref:phosphate acetyltransferase n=1 Tax=Snodgrassella alvi TaxID=1196083 RepID=UPI0009FDBBE2|nr:phosphate acetyltransferase [Snodgrassella alvi]ORE99472.1 phosphate acetyltransferase [Snodgrassella alvi]ORF07565.1 phosphate acetyltransferase [Snodgrassella alvi]ORF13075.1 phosphate acetyltransferase [Snodgrassella alvi]ORF13897.1 phosphate acetyltransferase [Snodgrassella alvi]ORF17780.1 phosphate acetyltransferase [Snodgrassella alvi]
MSQFLLVPTGTQTNITAVGLGVAQVFVQTGHVPLYFKPIAEDVAKDNTSELVQAVLNQKLPVPQSLSNLDERVYQGQADDVVEEFVAAFHEMDEIKHDVVVIEGAIPEAGRTYLPAQNVKIAAALNARVILVAAVAGQTAAAVAAQLQLTLHDYAHGHTEISGFILTADAQNVLSAGFAADVQVELAKHGKQLECIGLVTVPADVQVAQAQEAAKAVAAQLNADVLGSELAKPVAIHLAPAAFRYQMMARARAANKRIVLPEGNEPRTIAAAAICENKGIARCVLLAKKAEVEAVAQAKGITLPASLEIIDPDSIRERYIAPMVELRKSKGLTPEQAAEQLQDTVVLGTMMLATGDVDGLVSGAVHTTANTIRPALQLIKTAPGASLVSSVFFMLMPDQVLVYGDCAVNPNPTAEQLADIAIQSADSAKAFGIEPKVAMISYSTGSSGSGPDVETVTAATKLAQQKRPDLHIDGPLQYDAASVPSVGKQKAPDSKVAGQATVFVFPDLNTGNTTYKAVQRSAHVLSVGPMLQGLNKPVNDLSRGALIEDIVYTIALTAIQAVQMN